VCGSAAIQKNHMPTVGKQWKIQSQCVFLQLSRKITYPLWAGNGRYRVSVWFCSYPEKSHTYCGHAMGNRVSVWFCSYPARSRTSCGPAMADTVSVYGSAAIQKNHVQIAGDRWERQKSVSSSAPIQQYHVQAVHERWERQKSMGVTVSLALSLSNAITPFVSWRGARRIEFGVIGSVYCLERRGESAGMKLSDSCSCSRLRHEFQIPRYIFGDSALRKCNWP
jgi:hypothetical protein